MIACSGPFLPARWLLSILWSGGRIVPRVGGWMLVMGRWLAEASFFAEVTYGCKLSSENIREGSF